MESRNIFVYNSPEFLRAVSKKGTESDITIHHRKDGDVITTFLEPSRFPEKLSSLTDCAYVADMAIINGDQINRELGEVILALDLMQKKKGFVLITEESRKGQLGQLFRGTVAEHYEFFSGNPMELMEQINNGHVERDQSENTVVIIDHFFKVKSVGTVALGFVMEGILKKHQKLFLSDSGKEVQIRSIQMHDEDQEIAPAGSRVGLALKNVDADELGRGMYLSSEEMQMSESLRPPDVHHMVKNRITENMEIFVSDELRYQRGFLTDGTIKLEKPIPSYGGSVIVSNPNLTPRLIGRSAFS